MIDQLILDNIPRNYLVSSMNKNDRYLSVINKIANELDIAVDSILNNPDIKYVALPVLDKLGKIIDSVPNEYILLHSYGLIDKIDSNKRHLILGGQANLWTEYIQTTTQAEYMLFPRLYALSEVVWTPKNKKDYTDFVGRLKKHLKRSAQENVNFSQNFE